MVLSVQQATFEMQLVFICQGVFMQKAAFAAVVLVQLCPCTFSALINGYALQEIFECVFVSVIEELWYT